MIISVQLVKIRNQHSKVIYPWALVAVQGEDTSSSVFNKIKQGKKYLYSIFLSFSSYSFS